MAARRARRQDRAVPQTAAGRIPGAPPPLVSLARRGVRVVEGAALEKRCAKAPWVRIPPSPPRHSHPTRRPPRADAPAERSPSGLWRRTGNAVRGNPSRVRIPPSPPPHSPGPPRPRRGARVPSLGGLVDRTGRGYPPSIDLRLRVSKPDRRDASLAREPDRRPSRPRGFSDLTPGFVLPGTASSRRRRSRAPHGSGHAALSTTRAAQPPGGDPSRSGSPGTNWRVFPRRTGRWTRGARADGVRRAPAQRRRPSRAPCYDPDAVLGGELAVPCTCNPL